MINDLITFGCGVVIGVAGSYIAVMMSRMWRDTHQTVTRGATMRLDELASFKRCLETWATRYGSNDHARRHVGMTKDLIALIDERLLNQ